MEMLVNWLVYTIAILITAYILPGVHVDNFWIALVTAVVLGIINTFVRPVLIALTLPLNILTLGLFTLIINALLVLLAANIVPGFVVDNFWWALLFSVILSIVSSFLNAVFPTHTHHAPHAAH